VILVVLDPVGYQDAQFYQIIGLSLCFLLRMFGVVVMVRFLLRRVYIR